MPPSRWTATAGPSQSAPPPEVPGLKRTSSVVRELQGNLLFIKLHGMHPALAGKLTGMLLDGLEPDVISGELLADDGILEEAVTEALKVLSEAGDERAVAALARERVDAPAPPAVVRSSSGSSRPAPAHLTVDVAAAQEAKAEVEAARELPD